MSSHLPEPHPDEHIKSDKLARIIKKESLAGPAGERLKDIPVTGKNYEKFRGEKYPQIPRSVIWGVVGLIAFFIAAFTISFFVLKQQVKASISSQVATLQTGVSDLQNLDPQSAQEQFSMLTGTSTPTLESVVSAFSFLFKGGTTAFTSFGDIANQLSQLSQAIGSTENAAFNFVASGQGADLISDLTNVHSELAAIDSDTSQLSTAANSVGASSVFSNSNFYLPLKAQLEGAEDFLGNFTPWLATSTPHHLLVLFQNPSELRPAGGFLGSYADVTLAGGNITNISVHDIADVDATFKKNIVPPMPLQLEVTRWRPADANWFFDFPTSASETISLFEQSGLYSSTTFDGAIAISPKVVSDLLSITGPISVSSTKTVFNSGNFLVQVQNIVQQGQAQNSLGQATYPKAVIGQLAQAIFQQLASSTDAQKQELLSMALDWVNKKDVMAYFQNPDFENFLMAYGAAGDVYQLPQNFNGDYLAIVDSNILGDKSDLYVSSTVTLDCQINADGTISDYLTIDRKHNGNTSPYWWYQTTNQDYIQVFVPQGDLLTNETGGVKKTITPPINYAKSGYLVDPTIFAIESSTEPLFIYPAVTQHEEDDKTVFATWSRVAKGKSTEIEFDYTHQAFLPPQDGTQYQFIFEKQAGTNRSYDFEIDAPLGYVFAENDLATYEYISDDPPGRLIVDLTLQKI